MGAWVSPAIVGLLSFAATATDLRKYQKEATQIARANTSTIGVTTAAVMFTLLEEPGKEEGGGVGLAVGGAVFEGDGYAIESVGGDTAFKRESALSYPMESAKPELATAVTLKK